MNSGLFSLRGASQISAFMEQGEVTPERLLLLAETNFYSGRLERALNLAEALGKYVRFGAHSRILTARILLAKGEKPRAIDLLEQLAGEQEASAIPPDLAPLVCRRILANSGRAAALRFLDRNQTAVDYELTVLHATLLATIRQFGAAIALVEKRLGRERGSERNMLWVLHGRLLALNGDPTRGAESLVRGMSALSPDWRSYFRAARIAVAGQRSQAAERWIGAALVFGPQNSATLWGEAGRLRFFNGNLNGTLSLCQRSIALRYNAEYQILIALAYERMGNVTLACEELQKLAVADEIPFELQFKASILLARIAVRGGALDLAIETADRLQDYDDHPQVVSLMDELNVACELRNREADEVEYARTETTNEHDRNHVPVAAADHSGSSFDLVVKGREPAAFAPTWSEEDLRRTANFFSAMSEMGRVLSAIMVREVRTRFGRSAIGYLWAIIEPAIYMAVLIIVFLMFRPTMGSQYHMSVAFFTVSGFVPFVFMTNTYSRTVNVTRSSGTWLLMYPNVKPLDIPLARGLLEFATYTVLFVLYLTLCAFIFGDKIRILNPVLLFTCLVLLWSIGLGIALLVEATMPLAEWSRVAGGSLMRKLFFSSGIFWTPQMLPDWIANILLWNPVLQLVTYSRSCFTPLIATRDLDFSYAATCSIAILLLGLTAHFGLRGRVLER